MSTQIHEEARPAATPLGRGSLVLYYCVGHHVWAKDRSPITRFRDSWAFCVSGCGFGHEWRRIEPVSYSNLWSFGPTFLDEDATLTRV